MILKNYIFITFELKKQSLFLLIKLPEKNKTNRKKKINKQEPENKYGENWGPVLFQSRAIIFYFFFLLELQGLFGDSKRRMSANNNGKWQLCFQESDYKER